MEIIAQVVLLLVFLHEKAHLSPTMYRTVVAVHTCSLVPVSHTHTLLLTPPALPEFFPDWYLRRALTPTCTTLLSRLGLVCPA